MPSSHLLAATFVYALAWQAAHATVPLPECKRFDAIYETPKDLCEKMWDGAFVYEPDEDKAYTQWFFDKENPNDKVARALGKLGSAPHDTCHLQYFHKDAPAPEPDGFTECHPWKDNACCAHGTVETHTKLKEGYGKEYHWDRCGPLSPECERFFVQEACFYECDPNAGLYRKFHAAIYNESNPDHNQWQMHGMPIKASYCDAWFTACRKDKFCASAGGSFFSCAAEYEKVDKVAALQKELEVAQAEAEAVAQAQAQKDDSEGLSTASVIVFISAGVAIFALSLCACCLIMRERAGKPMFGKLLNESRSTNGAQQIGGSGI